MAAADATADATAHIADAADANDADVDTDADNADADTADADDRCPPAASKSLRDFDAAQGIDKWKKEYL